MFDKEIKQNFQQKMINIKDDDPFKNAKIKCKNQNAKTKKVKNTLKNKNIKTMINFNFNECNSMKSIAIKRNTM